MSIFNFLKRAFKEMYTLLSIFNNQILSKKKNVPVVQLIYKNDGLFKVLILKHFNWLIFWPSQSFLQCNCLYSVCNIKLIWNFSLCSELNHKLSTNHKEQLVLKSICILKNASWCISRICFRTWAHLLRLNNFQFLYINMVIY